MSTASLRSGLSLDAIARNPVLLPVLDGLPSAELLSLNIVQQPEVLLESLEKWKRRLRRVCSEQ